MTLNQIDNWWMKLNLQGQAHTQTQAGRETRAMKERNWIGIEMELKNGREMEEKWKSNIIIWMLVLLTVNGEKQPKGLIDCHRWDVAADECSHDGDKSHRRVLPS